METVPDPTKATAFKDNLEYARRLDGEDPLSAYRERFHIPAHTSGDSIYFCGNSLGLQPRSVRRHLDEELEDWARLGVEGHIHGRNPWLYYHHFCEEATARLVGAKPAEVVVMNGLTVNLNLMMVSFYRPTADRYKILMEAKAFPSDQYAVEMQVRFHGFDPADAIIEVAPREGEHAIRDEDVLEAIERHGEEIALVMIGGVNYYTGQVFDMAAITEAGHAFGANVGFDLAHAAGNVPLALHDWGADFAVWCTYKYLNSGPGGVSGVFVHERHAESPELPRFAGWWGNDEKTRFEMRKGFHPQPGAAGWQMSNAPVLTMAAHRASLSIFDEVGMDALVEKSRKLTGYLAFLLDGLSSKRFEVITPTVARGCQLSILTDDRGKATFDALTEEGIIVDWREPNVIRLAPVPLYNGYEEVYRFARILERFG